MHAFSDKPGQTIASLGEKSLLKRVRTWLGEAAPPAPAGMGDDCAEIPATENNRLVTTDSVVLGRHFEATTDPRLVGEKLLKRNLSDIAAMGGIPTRAVIAGFLPRRLRLSWLEECLRGMAATAMDYHVQLVGGDLAETGTDLALNLTLLGAVNYPLYRTGSRPGDWICVTGALGGSLRNGRHLSFIPRIREGQALALEKFVHACIDVSDGLAIDLLNLLGEAFSAELDPEAVPVHPDAVEAAKASGRTPLDHALNDGEDHELLFTMEPLSENAWAAWAATLEKRGLARVTRIGTVTTRGESAILDAGTGRPFPQLSGYDHFG